MKWLHFATLIFGFMLTACATPKPVKPKPAATDAQQAQFDQGLRALDAQDYAGAARIFDELLLQKPGTELDLVTLYNSGSAYEGMGNCQKAVERYRQVVRSSAGTFQRLESESLFRLALAYECLGQDRKTITALLDASKRTTDLSPETLNAEIPARLAAAYARMGNRERALSYFNQASRALKSIVARGGSKVQLELLARTMFFMGKLTPTQRRGEVAANTYLPSLSMQQPYLLQSMELQIEPSSEKAEEDLRTAYENIFKFNFTDANAKREFYTRALQSLAELNNIRMPGGPAAESKLFADLGQTQRRLQNELSKMPDATPLTPEAQRREGLRRNGRLVDPTKNKKTE